MKKFLFSKILKKLRKYFGKGLKGHAFRRVKKLAALICGILRKKKPHLSAIGTGIQEPQTAHSQEKAAKLFLENKWVDYETFYLPYISELLAQILSLLPPDAKVKFVIDGSKMGKDHMALMISLVYKNRGIPLIWLVHKKPKGHFDTLTHLELVKQFKELIHPILSTQRSIVLLGDGEFDSIELQQFCQANEWYYVFRTACDTVLYENGSRFQPKELDIKDIKKAFPTTQQNEVTIQQNQQDFLFIPDVEFTEKKYQKVNFVYWHNEKYQDALPLISNMDEPIDLIQAYARRYSIECLFKDLKSTSFNLHKTRLKSIHAISNLIMVGAFAFSLLLKLALAYENQPIRKFIHRIRFDRSVCTLFRFGIDLIEYFLDEGIDFNFSFQFSKNSS